MKRDMELIRKLIRKVEESPNGWAPDNMSVDGYTEDQIGYHSYLIVHDGLAVGYDLTHSGSNGPDWRIQHLRQRAMILRRTPATNSYGTRSCRMSGQRGSPTSLWTFSRTSSTRRSGNGSALTEPLLCTPPRTSSET